MQKAGIAAAAAAAALEPFRDALQLMLIERAVDFALRKPPLPAAAGIVLSVSTPAALYNAVSAMASCAMGDASEAIEDIITLIHEAEAVVAALLATGSVHAAMPPITLPPPPAGSAAATSLPPPPPLAQPPGVFSAALDLSLAAGAPTSAALRAFGELHEDTVRTGVWLSYPQPPLLEMNLTDPDSCRGTY
jgi:hypothetical protein